MIVISQRCNMLQNTMLHETFIANNYNVISKPRKKGPSKPAADCDSTTLRSSPRVKVPTSRCNAASAAPSPQTAVGGRGESGVGVCFRSAVPLLDATG